MPDPYWHPKPDCWRCKGTGRFKQRVDDDHGSRDEEFRCYCTQLPEVSVLDVIRARDTILSRIRAAKIGVGANKVGYYGPDVCGRVAKRKVGWMVDLKVAEKELEEFDAYFDEIQIDDLFENEKLEMLEILRRTNAQATVSGSGQRVQHDEAGTDERTDRG